MAVGFQFEDVCYPTQAQANDAYFDAAQPSYFYNSATNPTTVQITKFILASGTWILNKQTVTMATGATVNNWNAATVAPTFRSCTYDLPAYDYVGATAAWVFGLTAVVLHWLLAKNIGLILEAIRRF